MIIIGELGKNKLERIWWDKFWWKLEINYKKNEVDNLKNNLSY